MSALGLVRRSKMTETKIDEKYELFDGTSISSVH